MKKCINTEDVRALFQSVLKMSHLYHKVFALFVKVPEFVLMPCLIWFELFLWCCRMLSSLLLALYFCHVLPICIPNFGCDVLTLDLLLLSLSPVHPIWVAVVDCDAKNWLQFQTRWLMELPWELRSAGLISQFLHILYSKCLIFMYKLSEWH